jgi:hypothetical protein
MLSGITCDWTANHSNHKTDSSLVESVFRIAGEPLLSSLPNMISNCLDLMAYDIESELNLVANTHQPVHRRSSFHFEIAAID